MAGDGLGVHPLGMAGVRAQRQRFEGAANQNWELVLDRRRAARSA